MLGLKPKIDEIPQVVQRRVAGEANKRVGYTSCNARRVYCREQGRTRERGVNITLSRIVASRHPGFSATAVNAGVDWPGIYSASLRRGSEPHSEWYQRVKLRLVDII